MTPTTQVPAIMMAVLGLGITGSVILWLWARWRISQGAQRGP